MNEMIIDNISFTDNIFNYDNILNISDIFDAGLWPYKLLLMEEEGMNERVLFCRETG